VLLGNGATRDRRITACEKQIWYHGIAHAPIVAFADMQHSLLTATAILAACVVPAIAFAQAEPVTTPPPNLVVPNYNTVPVGPFAGLEGMAFAARVADPSAAWFNPAGLVRQTSAQISGSAGVYSRTSVSPDSLANRGGSIQQLPNFVGFTLRLRDDMTAGAALLTSNAWNQEIDSERFTNLPAGQERFAFSADSEFSQRVAAISAGYHRGVWRYGGGFAFSLTSLRLVQGASDRIADVTGLQTLLVASRVSGTDLQLRGQGGVQYDRGDWRFGGAVHTPGVSFYRSGSVALDGVLDARTGSIGASLFDTDAGFRYHLPWEFQGGIALVRTRFEIEVDVQGYTPISAYSLVTSDQPTRVYGDTGVGQPPFVLSQPFQGLTSESQGVVNVGGGGQFKVFKDRNFLIHAGVASNRSPVGDADEVFNEVNLISWTVGVSGSAGRFQFSVGLNRQTGTSDEITLRNLLDGAIIRTRADVRMTGFVYQLAYQF
jgi:hypothetical protein